MFPGPHAVLLVKTFPFIYQLLRKLLKSVNLVTNELSNIQSNMANKF